MSGEPAGEAANLQTLARNPRSPFGFRFVAPLALGSTLNPINSTMIATALVPIAATFGESAAAAGWLIAGLYIASAVAQPTMGRLADLFGPRRIYLIALVLVATAGLLGRYAPNLKTLILARVVLGIGTSGAYPSAMRIFRMQAARFGAEPPRVAMGVLSLAALSSSALGPWLGGAMTGAFGWHAIFTVNVPLALIGILLVLLWVPADAPAPARPISLLQGLDLAGLALFAAFLVCLMLFLLNLHRPSYWALLAAGLFGAAFVAQSLRSPQPFIDVRMLSRNRPLALTYLRAAALSMVVYCIIYGFAQWLESAAGMTSSRAGQLMLPMSFIAACSSFAGARTRGIRGPFLVSIASAVAGCVCFCFVDAATSVYFIAAAAALFGLPQGLMSTSTQAAVYIQSPAEGIGSAAGLQRTAQYLGAIAAAGLLAIMFGPRATDHGFHGVAIAMGVLSALLLVFTFFDRTIPRTA